MKKTVSKNKIILLNEKLETALKKKDFIRSSHFLDKIIDQLAKQEKKDWKEFNKICQNIR